MGCAQAGNDYNKIIDIYESIISIDAFLLRFFPRFCQIKKIIVLFFCSNITKEWIQKELSKIVDLEDLITNRIADSGKLIRRVEWKTDNACFSAYPIYLTTELENFYVYEMTNGDIYLNFVLDIVMEVEAELEMISTIGTKIIEIESWAELSSRIVNKEIIDIEIDDFYFY